MRNVDSGISGYVVIVKFDVIFSGVKKFLFIDWSKLSFNCFVS